MKATLNVMKKLAKNIENTSALCASNVRIHTEGCGAVESILRFEDGNYFTISCYLMEDVFQIGYLLEDGTYKWYGTLKLNAFKDISEFMFLIGMKLKEVENYIEQYVIS